MSSFAESYGFLHEPVAVFCLCSTEDEYVINQAEDTFETL